MATVLICIVAVFLICHIPRVVLNCTEFFLVDQIIECPDHFMPPNWNLCLASVNHALLIINASINFIIYTSVGDSFKKALRKLVERYGNCELLFLLDCRNQHFRAREGSNIIKKRNTTLVNSLRKQVNIGIGNDFCQAPTHLSSPTN